MSNGTVTPTNVLIQLEFILEIQIRAVFLIQWGGKHTALE